jgi:SAM-dependent methyltransferase
MEQPLNETFWDDLWKSNETRWDMGMVSPPLKEYIDKLEDKSLKILIPGCGNAYEAAYLLEQGFTDVTLVDISPALADSLREKFQAQSDKLKVVCADFFELTGEFDLILEQTFFCALDPTLRANYVTKMHDLLSEEGRLAGLLFNTQFEKDGPPFGGAKEEYKMLFSNKFQFETFEECNNSYPRRAGTELFINFKKIQ